MSLIFMGQNYKHMKLTMESKLEKITPYLTVSTFKCQDIIYKGIYDEYFDEAVNKILDERGISDSLDNVEKERRFWKETESGIHGRYLTPWFWVTNTIEHFIDELQRRIKNITKRNFT